MIYEMCFDVFLFNAGDKSGEFHGLDGAREICGYVLGGEIKENFSNL